MMCGAVVGGGAHNGTLIAALRDAFDVPVQPASDFAVSVDFVEAMAFAWLAHARLSGQSVLPPALTGARHAVVGGGVYGGS